ncbi:hypothetical protein ACFVZM_08975 [Streptomyces sioyaensis]|uniref:hypothetical protein n=1 Tax=Streptomyces sioyaensis TaxID=67364 RepID=UPI003677155F
MLKLCRASVWDARPRRNISLSRDLCVRAGVAGTGSFGAALSRYVPAQGVEVFDANRPDRTDRRQRGKSDPLDARNAALGGGERAGTRSSQVRDGPVQIARMYQLTEGSAVFKRYATREVFHLVRPTQP